MFSLRILSDGQFYEGNYCFLEPEGNIIELNKRDTQKKRKKKKKRAGCQGNKGNRPYVHYIIRKRNNRKIKYKIATIETTHLHLDGHAFRQKD